MNVLLAPFGWMYGGLMGLRNHAYDAGWLASERVGVPVIAVGNLTAGGTGKTPLVEHIVRVLLEAGRSPAMVSRGYGRTTGGVLVVSNRGEVRARYPESGDEPAQIALKFPGASVVVGERRVDAARAAIDECGADVIVLDDAYQHRAIVRDLNILVLEAGRDIRTEGVIPSGRLRENAGGIRRADLIGFSGAAEKGTPAWADGVIQGAPSFSYRQRIEGLCDDRGVEVPVPASAVFAFSGIGNPDGFIASLKEKGIAVAGERRFRDHQPYSGSDLLSVCDGAAAAGATIVVTTEKDAVRIGERTAIFGGRGLMFARTRSRVEFLSGAGDLERAVRKACST